MTTISFLAAILIAAMTIPVDAAGKKRRHKDVGIGGIGVRVVPAPVRNKRRIQRKRRGNLIAPYRAAKRAQGVYGGKILGVRRRGDVYMVKLRDHTKVFIVIVDAISGQILDQ